MNFLFLKNLAPPSLKSCIRPCKLNLKHLELSYVFKFIVECNQPQIIQPFPNPLPTPYLTPHPLTPPFTKCGLHYWFLKISLYIVLIKKVQWYIHPCFHSNRRVTTNQWALKTYRASSNEETVFQFKIFHESYELSYHVQRHHTCYTNQQFGIRLFCFLVTVQIQESINGLLQGN